MEFIYDYWDSVLGQKKDSLRHFFHSDAYVNWHNTNEHFTVDDFIRANCEYPGKWAGKIERIEHIEDLIITVTNVYSKDNKLSFHVTSFIMIKNGLISSIDEYWGDDGTAPEWRLDKKIGIPIDHNIEKQCF